MEHIHPSLKAHTQATRSERVADALATMIGSWHFIVFQTILVTVWVGINISAYIYAWDPYPFILLNLLFSTQAAYTAPIILQSQNRAAIRDRRQAMLDYETNVRAEHKIEQLTTEIKRLEEVYLKELVKRQ